MPSVGASVTSPILLHDYLPPQSWSATLTSHGTHLPTGYKFPAGRCPSRNGLVSAISLFLSMIYISKLMSFHVLCVMLAYLSTTSVNDFSLYVPCSAFCSCCQQGSLSIKIRSMPTLQTLFCVLATIRKHTGTLHSFFGDCSSPLTCMGCPLGIISLIQIIEDLCGFPLFLYKTAEQTSTSVFLYYIKKMIHF